MIITSTLTGKSDNVGNDLYLRAFQDENKKYIGGTIFLKLKSESKYRNLGNIYFTDNSFHCVRNSTKHYHYVSKSYGFNWNIINDDELNIQVIHLIIDHETKYVIPKYVLEKYGKFLNFKKEGFELQKFLPFDLIKNFRDETYTKKEKNIDYDV
jgi:hypothetical protein